MIGLIVFIIMLIAINSQSRRIRNLERRIDPEMADTNKVSTGCPVMAVLMLLFLIAMITVGSA